MLHYGLPLAKVVFGWERGTVLMGSLVSAHNRRTDRKVRVVDVALDIRAVFPSSSDFHGPGAPRAFNDVFRCLFS